MNSARLFFLTLLCAMPAIAADATPAAMAMVENLRLGENISGMSYRFAARTMAYRSIVRSVGLDEAAVIVKEEIRRIRPKYQARWDRNLAAAYAESFAPNELESIAVMGRASPYAGKLSAMRNEVGRSMQEKSTGLLNEILTEALKAALARVPPKK